VNRATRFRVALSVSLAAISIAACSALTTFDSLEADPTPTTVDAGDSSLPTPPKDAQEPHEQQTDAASADANDGAIEDGSFDAGPVIPEGGYCATLSPQPFLCNDFEPSADASWQLETAPFTTSTAEISTEQALSLPYSLKVVVNTMPNSSGNSDYSQSFNATGATHVVTSYDLYVPAAPTLALNLSSIKFSIPGFGDRYVSIQLSSSGKLTVFQNQDTPRGPDGGVNFVTIGMTNASLNAWMHIVLDVAPGDAPTVSASLNNVPFVSNASLAPALPVGNVRVRSGVSYLTPEAGTFAAYFDNIVVDFK